MKYVLLLWAGLPLMAAIEGTVINKTTGKPQAGVEVALTKLGEGGMKEAATARSDSAGKFKLESDANSAHLIQARYMGVSYSKQLGPMQASGVEIEVYDALLKVSAAEVTQHMILLETDGQEYVINETVIYTNDSQTTWFDPKGTARFAVPAEAGANVMARAIAPGGMPVERPLKPAGEKGVFVIEYPVKPGETRFDISYKVPVKEGVRLAGRVLHDGGPVRLVVPTGITVEGEGLEPMGKEPSTGAALFTLKNKSYAMTVKGTGQLRQAAPEQPAEEDGPRIQVMQPPGYDRMWKWVLGLALLALILAFAGHAMRSPQSGGERRA